MPGDVSNGVFTDTNPASETKTPHIDKLAAASVRLKYAGSKRLNPLLKPTLHYFPLFAPVLFNPSTEICPFSPKVAIRSPDGEKASSHTRSSKFLD